MLQVTSSVRTRILCIKLGNQVQLPAAYIGDIMSLYNRLNLMFEAGNLVCGSMPILLRLPLSFQSIKGIRSTLGAPTPFSAITTSGLRKYSGSSSPFNTFSQSTCYVFLKKIQSSLFIPLYFVTLQSIITEIRFSFIKLCTVLHTALPMLFSTSDSP